KTWMDRHYLEMLSMPELADMANLSPSHFSAVFHRLTGASPKTYILHLRLNRAASLLTDTVYTISDIAGLVGFEYLANFTQAFRKHFGDTPSAYRRKYKNIHDFYEDEAETRSVY
ncbi:MAG TPA: AraC family transcriptional regulator, partial [Armatimonadota bacterium]|nr:AraC family transcriptional regulator [Armatimonadota bacterium]